MSTEDKEEKHITDIRPIILSKLSRENLLPVYIIRSIIAHQFDSTANAFKDPKNRIVEVPGIGRFLFREKRAKDALQSCENTINRYTLQLEAPMTEMKRTGILDRVSLVTKIRNNLKKLIYGNQSDNRGMEK